MCRFWRKPYSSASFWGNQGSINAIKSVSTLAQVKRRESGKISRILWYKTTWIAQCCSLGGCCKHTQTLFPPVTQCMLKNLTEELIWVLKASGWHSAFSFDSHKESFPGRRLSSQSDDCELLWSRTVKLWIYELCLIQECVHIQRSGITGRIR